MHLDPLENPYELRAIAALTGGNHCRESLASLFEARCVSVVNPPHERPNP
jgi:hypothetical protein